MTFIEQLKAHIGGLIRIKTKLYWYRTGKWDKSPGRICLVLDNVCKFVPLGGNSPQGVATSAALGGIAPRDSTAFVQLLIDGESHWVWATDMDIELIPGGDQ